jgi:predicted negative regulator of RcsB-dependent stress response
MARKRPSSSKKQRARSTGVTSSEDVVTASVLTWTAWARERTQLLAVAGVLLVVVVFGLIYMVNQRSDRLSRAAAELVDLRGAATFLPAQEIAAEIRAYADRFEGTPYALEALLMLGEVHLDAAQPDSAIATLEGIAPAYGGPLEIQATFLLATSYEEAGRWSDAAAIYEELIDEARFSFQEQEATEGLARAHIARGDRDAAIAAYESILASLESEDPDRAEFEMRLAELQAQRL